MKGGELPIPPPGTYWDITGTPEGPWVWSSGTYYHEANGYMTVEHYAVASAPGASAVWRIE